MSAESAYMYVTCLPYRQTSPTAPALLYLPPSRVAVSGCRRAGIGAARLSQPMRRVD